MGASGSSGMVSLEKGLAALVVLLLESLLGDFALAAGVVREVVVVGVLLLLVGLPALGRDEEGPDDRFGGADDAVLPRIVRLVLSAVGSVRAVLELVPPRVVVRDDGRLFSSPAADGTSSLLLAGFRVAGVAEGRVGGLLMVLPEVREERVPARAVEVLAGDVGVREVVPSREDVVDGFLVSSLFAGVFAPGVVRRSMMGKQLLFTLQLLPTRRRSGCDHVAVDWLVV